MLINKTYVERAESLANPLGRKLLKLISEKESNLAFSADLTDRQKLLELTDKVGPHICVLKTHLDIMDGFDGSLVSDLRCLADKHGFLILEDRKFADIGSTVRSQYRDGYLKIADWADSVTVHAVAGYGTVQGLKEVGAPKGRSCLLLAEMSSSGNLMDERYTRSVMQMAVDCSDFVMGFIAQRRLMEVPDFLYFTPGIGLVHGKDNLGQNYRDPAEAVSERGTDVMIVGRHIYDAKDPVSEALRYRELGWKGYLKRIQRG